jgi:hypothetical protein
VFEGLLARADLMAQDVRSINLGGQLERRGQAHELAMAHFPNVVSYWRSSQHADGLLRQLIHLLFFAHSC